MRSPARLLHSSRASSSSSADLPSSSSPAITVDSDMVVILASLLCALICVAGLALVARCACRRRSSAVTNPAAASSAPSSRAAGGLKKKAIDALPTVSFAADAEKHQHQQQQKLHAECAICLAEFAGGEELRVLPHCGHGFHLHCIDTWLGAHATCPSCRAAITIVNNAELKPVPVVCSRCGEMDP